MTCPSWHFPIICLGLRISEPVVPCLAGSGWMWSVCHRATSRAFAIRRGISRALGPLAHDPWFCNCQGWCVNDKYLRLVRGRLTAHFRSKQTPPQTLVIRLKKSTSYPYVSHPLPRLWDLGHSAIPPRLKEDAAICSSPWVDPCWHRLQKVTIPEKMPWAASVEVIVVSSHGSRPDWQFGKGTYLWQGSLDHWVGWSLKYWCAWCVFFAVCVTPLHKFWWRFLQMPKLIISHGPSQRQVGGLYRSSCVDLSPSSDPSCKLDDDLRTRVTDLTPQLRSGIYLPVLQVILFIGTLQHAMYMIYES